MILLFMARNVVLVYANDGESSSMKMITKVFVVVINLSLLGIVVNFVFSVTPLSLLAERFVRTSNSAVAFLCIIEKNSLFCRRRCR